MLFKRGFASSNLANYYDIVINGGGMIGSVLACKLGNMQKFVYLNIKSTFVVKIKVNV